VFREFDKLRRKLSGDFSNSSMEGEGLAPYVNTAEQKGTVSVSSPKEAKSSANIAQRRKSIVDKKASSPTSLTVETRSSTRRRSSVT